MILAINDRSFIENFQPHPYLLFLFSIHFSTSAQFLRVRAQKVFFPHLHVSLLQRNFSIDETIRAAYSYSCIVIRSNN